MSGSGDKSARVWDMDTGGERYNLAVEDQPAEGAPVDAGVTSVAVSPDGKLLAAGSLDTIVRLWDATTGVLLDKLRGHRDSVYSVAFSPDGQWLVSGSLDKTLKIWNLLPLKAVLASGGSGAGVTSSTPGNGAASAEGETKKEGEATASKPEESTAVTTCMSTLTGHKVRLSTFKSTKSANQSFRITFFPSQYHLMAIGSCQALKIAESLSGIRKLRPQLLFCKGTRTQVSHFALCFKCLPENLLFGSHFYRGI